MRGRFEALFTAAVILLFGATNARAFVPLPNAAHMSLLFLHVVGAIIFMGNIVVSAMWMAHATKTRNTHVLHFATRSIARADWLFTLPGIVLLLGPGLFMLGRFGGFPGKAWVELALTFFILSVVIWVSVLIRLQKRMIDMTTVAATSNSELDDSFYRVVKRWSMWGGIATLLPFASLVLMVFKPGLWR